MSIQLSGIFSQIDTDSIISKLMAVNRKPLSALQRQRAVLTSRKSAVEDIESRLQTLRSHVASMRETGGNTLRSVLAKSSDTNILTISAAQNAGEGSHTLVVNRLASAQKEIHDGLAALTTLVGAGQFVYTYGTGGSATTRTVQTTADTTLEELRDLINNDGGNTGVTASVLEYDAGGGQVYHLVLTGRDSGGDYDIAVDASTTLDGTGGTVDFTDSTFTVSQTAQDSQVRVDGYPSADWIERSSNTLTDVIAGLTLDIQSTGTVNIAVTRDTAQLTQDMDNLVSIYNGIAGKVAEYTGYNADTGLSGILQGDSTTSMALARIRSLFVGTPAGFLAGTDAYALPASIGLELGKGSASADGSSTLDPEDMRMLSLDSDTFSSAVAADYLGVLSLIGAIGTGVSDSSEIQFTSATNDTTAGTYEIEVDFTAGSVDLARIRAVGETAWQYMDVNGNSITGTVGNAEQGLELTAAFAGTGTRTATMRVRKGLAGNVYDAVDDLLDSVSGLIQVKKDHIDTAVESIDDEMDTLKIRLETKEAVLKKKYARLEATLARLDGQRGAFDALFKSLATNSSS